MTLDTRAAVVKPMDTNIERLRFPVVASVKVTDIKSNQEIAGSTSDLGLGGCYVDTMNPFPSGAKVKIRIERGRNSFEIQGHVVHSQARMGMGIEFTGADPDDVRLFQDWMLELTRKIKPESETPEQSHRGMPEEGSSRELQYVLNELIITLMRKGLLGKTEGETMLQRLYK